MKSMISTRVCSQGSSGRISVSMTNVEARKIAQGLHRMGGNHMTERFNDHILECLVRLENIKGHGSETVESE